MTYEEFSSPWISRQPARAKSGSMLRWLDPFTMWNELWA
jgi:hypothetical protein